jgi:hypothetical protein
MMLELLAEEVANVSVWLRIGIQSGSLAERANEVVVLHLGTHTRKVNVN